MVNEIRVKSVLNKHKKRMGIVAIVVGLSIFLQGCVNESVPRANDSGATSESIISVVNASNQFALDFYFNIKDDEKGNIFYSPYSISTALAMTYEGARGKTADEIQSVFHFPKDDATRRSSVAAIYNGLNKKDAKYRLHTANALWVQKGYQLLNGYTDTIEKYYLGKATNVDFAGATEHARQTINNWVEDKTDNKIKDLFPQGSLNSLTRLVLTNAIYFKGIWVKEFAKSETGEEDFRVSKDQTVKVPMMRRADNEAKFNYAETEELQILEMLYEGGDLSMLVLLPRSDDLRPLEDSLTLKKLNEWENELKEQRLDVYMPRFTFERKYFLNENLKEMGMPLAFTPPVMSPGADFSGISGDRDLFIQLVVHQAFVDVNEEGTEAAGATGVSVGIVSIGPRIPIFRADHPFIFIIQEKDTGNILFLGRVINPAK